MFGVIKVANMFRLLICLFGVLSASFSTTLIGQELEKQDFIIEAHVVESVLHKRICEKLQIDESQVELKKIFEDHVYRLTFTQQNKSNQIDLNDIAAVKGIHSCNKNVKTELRRVPNDPDYSTQTNLDLIKVERAWDFSTGGMTTGGKQIVMAIMDDGIDFEHEDLAPNIWNNPNEIPNNGIDDDDNGYIDDFFGLNVNRGNGDIDKSSHGTGVTGIMGAKGDNGIGISGVAWDAQLLLITGINTAADIIEANNYILNMRRRFNETNGAEGAFIVVSNYSGGIPRQFESEQPILCETYNALGAEGVLSLSAAPNRAENIDEIGDIPADCSSDHLIIATNIDVSTDELNASAGIGSRLVDLGAPGQGSLSTRLNNSYDNFGGTSAAAPHVSGTVALIYGAACSDFEDLIDTSPSQAALEVKNMILSTVDQKRSLAELSVSEGRLNAFGAIAGLRDFCSVESESINITMENPAQRSESIQIILQTPSLGEHELIIHDTAGRLMYVENIPPTLFGQSFIEIDNLNLNTGLYFLTVLNDLEKQTNKFFMLD